MINFDSVSFSSVSAEQCEFTSIGQRICCFSGGQTILRNHLSTIALSSKYWQSPLFLLRTHENRKIVITSQLHKGYFINYFQVGDSRSTKWLSSTHKIDWCLRYFEEIKVKKVLTLLESMKLWYPSWLIVIQLQNLSQAIYMCCLFVIGSFLFFLNLLTHIVMI